MHTKKEQDGMNSLHEGIFPWKKFWSRIVTGHDAYREPFEPLVPGVSFAQYNDLDSVKAW